MLSDWQIFVTFLLVFESSVLDNKRHEEKTARLDPMSDDGFQKNCAKYGKMILIFVRNGQSASALDIMKWRWHE